MVCRAWLAPRSPPRWRRWRRTRPELAGMGAAAAEVVQCCFGAQPVGVVAGGGEQLGGDVGADFEQGAGAGPAWPTSGASCRSRIVISSVNLVTRRASPVSAVAVACSGSLSLLGRW